MTLRFALPLVASLLVACSNYTPTETLVEPPSLTSADGVLEATFTARPSQLIVAGHALAGLTYDGAYVPPTLHVQPGDLLKLHVVNQLSEMTNVHYHGLTVSPNGNADNPYVMIDAGDRFDYELPIPPTHPRGLYWYHTHAMGMEEEQLFGGLSGALVVDGALDGFPELAGVRQRVLLLKDAIVARDGSISTASALAGTVTTLDDEGGGTGGAGATLLRTVNGQSNPTLTIAPGETQYWQIGNIGADAFYLLTLEGHKLYEVARDGKPHNQIIEQSQILLPPASRVEVLVQGAEPGAYPLKSLEYQSGPQGDDYPEMTVLTLISHGPAETPIALPSMPPQDDLSLQPIAHRRSFELSETYDGKTFFINNQMFDPDRVDTVVKLGDVEEWTLINVSGEQHVFHIHQVPFQVTEINGQAVPFTGLQDTITVPVETESGPGEVKVIIPFTDPLIVGKFMYHCHIAEHADHGMMANIVVQP